MRTFRGSATVEASMVMPIVILAVIGMLAAGISMLEKVKAVSLAKKCYYLEIINPELSPERVLRLKWLGITIIENMED